MYTNVWHLLWQHKCRWWEIFCKKICICICLCVCVCFCVLVCVQLCVYSLRVNRYQYRYSIHTIPSAPVFSTDLCLVWWWSMYLSWSDVLAIWWNTCWSVCPVSVSAWGPSSWTRIAVRTETPRQTMRSTDHPPMNAPIMVPFPPTPLLIACVLSPQSQCV